MRPVAPSIIPLNATHIAAPSKAMINTAIAAEMTPSPRSERSGVITPAARPRGVAKILVNPSIDAPVIDVNPPP